MSSDTARNTSDSRQRRAHLKSRNGCIRCKRLRKKCDERQPRCTRCLKQGVSCEYVSTTDGSDEVASKSTPERQVMQAAEESDSEMRDSTPAEPTPPQPVAYASVHVHNQNTTESAAPAGAGGRHTGRMLNARELELFNHYITHTSHMMAYDKHDMYPLKVGMPNLAFTNPAVMDCILAVAASCQCFDIMASSASTIENFDEVFDLLRLADSHHQSSLGHLQDDISERQFQSVLPNAALMVLYVLSCHYVRVLLVKKAKRQGISLPNDVLPFQSEWITSIRAAHVAFVGLLQPGMQHSDKSASPSSISKEELEQYTSPFDSSEPDHGTYLFQDGPAEDTRRLLLPIVSTTFEAALARLRARNGNLEVSTGSHAAPDVKLEACGIALKLLEELFLVVIGDNAPPKEPSQPPDFGALENEPPWLVRYLARVTSATPSKLWRRRIMAFLNQIPFEFLHLVQRALDCMPVEESQSLSRNTEQPLPLEAAHRPAMDIFAHWLVLVMLLDGVWWIGEIGHWELGRIIRFIEAHNFVLDLAPGETWWPKTMYAAKSAFGGT